MQRSLSYQTFSKLVAYLVILLIYEVLSSIYLFMPPLLGLAFLLFVYAVEEDRLDLLVFTLAYLLVFETDREFVLFSTLFFFILAYHIGLTKLRQFIDCKKCLDYISIALAYLGFWFFSFIFNQVIWIDLPQFDWTIFYYIAIECLVVFFL